MLSILIEKLPDGVDGYVVKFKNSRCLHYYLMMEGVEKLYV